MKTITILSVLCFLSVCWLLGTAHCFAAVPSLINYQGVLKDSVGVPYNGDAAMIFSFWDDSTSGDQLWEETQSIVSVSHGLFNVLLGSSVPIPDSVFSQPTTWFQVIANGRQLSPRRRIVSVGYAFEAHKAQTADSAFHAIRSDTADWALGVSMSYSDTAGYAFEAGTSIVADSARNADSAIYADTAEYTLTAGPDDDWSISGNNIYRLSGNVGIATSNPQWKLDVNGTGRFDGLVPGEVVFLKGERAIFFGGGGMPSGEIICSTGDDLYIQTVTDDNNIILLPDDTGKIGIGKTDPQWKLDVNGTGRFTGLLPGGVTFFKGETTTFLGTGGTPSGEIICSTGDDLYIQTVADENNIILLPDDTGKIGIGTTTPDEKLEVDGNAHITGNLTVDGNITPLPFRVYDSGWFTVTTNTTYIKSHGLGTATLLVQAYYSNSSNGSGDVVVSLPQIIRSSFDAQMAIVDIDATNIILRTQGSNLLRYHDANGIQKTPSTGYCRILALALE